ncbi:LOW QUALITY PROTEIN: bifunctional non-homologous end joining protein LigD [Rhizobium mongolense USDA 1844]|uniref:DNA ligase (ATP) n=1 Tax=Rhizobium mongolense USDA 1844 TaxID=1079460 RepID=A0A559SN66_9HYPH|nr:LOW QUALITY PROTEIN: bifunctional non-homologous end joining protein LigD [Rhizobium mongolense USDA 1844]
MAKSPPSKPLLATDKPLRSRARKPRDPAQPNLPLDPMPDRIEPCLALLKPRPPKGAEWAFEIKWDGYRIAIHIEPKGVRICNQSGHDWTDRFPAIAKAAKKLDVATAILDGEAVVLDEQGRSDFGLLQQSLGDRGGKRISTEAIFMAFDLLYFDGHDLRPLEFTARRHLLEGLIKSRDDVIRISEEIEADGDRLFFAACEHGLEGIIAKDRESPYRSGRRGDWQKIKCIQSDGFAIVGYEHSFVARAGIGSLLLGASHGRKLVYVGSVGTGFNERTAHELREALDKLKVKKPSVEYSGRRKYIVWVKPTLVAEVEYRAWTHDGKLRQSSYKGLREADENVEIYEIE